MANKRREPVGYRPFRTEPLLAEGLLAVSREDGDFMRRVSSGLFRLADEAGIRADRAAERAGRRAGEQAALAGRPEVTFLQGEAGPDAQSAQRMTRGLRGDVRKTISDAAARHGVDPNALLTIAMLESSGNPDAKNPNSSAGGLFQFIDSTAQQYGLRNRFDPAEASDAAARLARDNAAHLTRRFGRPPTVGELYLAHQQGAGGATRLLANPNARAADIVGADAVRLNGGNADMTAGEFANKWIRKAGGRAGAAVPQYSGGGFRPTGDDTIYGRAFDEAGARTYVQMLDTEMRSTTAQLFDQHRDDPVALERALADNRNDMLTAHVFDEIRADFDVSYGRVAESYLSQARRNLADKVEAQDRAAFVERTGALQTEIEQQIAAFDPASPAASDAIASTQAAIDDHYDSAVTRGILTPDAAAKAKIASRREAALGFYGKQAAELDASGIAAMRAEMAEDFADGGIDGLDGDGWRTLDDRLARLEKQKRTARDRASRDLRKTGDGFAARVADGFGLDPADWSRFLLDAGQADDGEAIVAATEAKIEIARSLAGKTLTEARAEVRELRRQAGKTPNEDQVGAVQFAEELLDKTERALSKDPVSHAEAVGVIEPQPNLYEAEGPDELAAIMAGRVEAAETTADHFGVSTRYLKAGEAKTLADAIRNDPAQGVGLAGAIVAGAGDRAKAVLAEFGSDAPMIAESGAIISLGGSARAAEDVILGYGKGADGKQLKGLKPAAAREGFQEATGTALVFAPADRQRIERAAASIARKRISEQGLDPESEEAIAIHTQAVSEAAGAVFDRGAQYGGFATYDTGLFSSVQVLVPSEIRADRFGDVIEAITDEDLAALPVKPKAGVQAFGLFGGDEVARSLAGTLQGAAPVAVDGGYAFAFGDPASDDPQFVAGDDGRIFVLDVMALKDRLAPRVPGAFR